jgi:hypothetical protein
MARMTDSEDGPIARGTEVKQSHYRPEQAQRVEAP